MRQLTKYWFPCLLALLLPAACAPARVATNAPERSLLEQATTRTDTSGWDIGFHHNFDYHWLSDHEVLFASNDDKNNGLYHRDILTREERRLYALEKLIMARWLRPNTPNVSPDGKWAFLHSYGRRRTELIALDGSCYRAIPQGVDYVWLVDSHHFGVRDVNQDETNGFTQNAVHHWFVGSVEHPFVGVKKRFRTNLALAYCGNLRIVHTGHAFVLTRWYTDSGDRLPDVHIYKSGLGLNTLPTAHVVIHSPNSAEIVYAYPSHQGDQIAYVLKRRHRHAASAPALTVYEVWISGSDGRHMHKLGSVEQKTASRDDNRDAPELRWLPGGNEISLLYRDVLYTVPVH